MITIDKLFKKSVLKVQDYKILGKLLYCSPIEDILSGFYLEKIQDHFYLWRFAMPLFIESDSLSFNFGQRLRDSKNSELFSLNDQDFDCTILEFSKLVNDEESNDLLHKLKEPEFFYNYFSPNSHDYSAIRDLTLVGVFLNKKDCDNDLRNLIALTKSYLETSYNKDYLNHLLVNYELLLNSSLPERVKIFSQWRQFTIKELKLDKVVSLPSIE